MAGPTDQSQTGAGVLAGLGLLAAVVGGSVWTAMAVVDGSVAALFVRFAVSVVGGFYYVVMYRVATGRTLARR